MAVSAIDFSSQVLPVSSSMLVTVSVSKHPAARRVYSCSTLNEMGLSARWLALIDRPCFSDLAEVYRGACLRKSALFNIHLSEYDRAADLCRHSVADPSVDAPCQYILFLIAAMVLGLVVSWMMLPCEDDCGCHNNNRVMDRVFMKDYDTWSSVRSIFSRQL